ncbi:hypothetical protein PC128_g15581 [Phytophthora cactorum]|nr:hypothetical protein PC128_g15581 [Phytophthora cactorum]
MHTTSTTLITTATKAVVEAIYLIEHKRITVFACKLKTRKTCAMQHKDVVQMVTQAGNRLLDVPDQIVETKQGQHPPAAECVLAHGKMPWLDTIFFVAMYLPSQHEVGSSFQVLVPGGAEGHPCDPTRRAHDLAMPEASWTSRPRAPPTVAPSPLIATVLHGLGLDATEIL